MNNDKTSKIAGIAIIEDAHKDLAQIVTIVSALAHANNIEKQIKIFPILLSSTEERAVNAEFNKIQKDIEDERLMSLHDKTEIVENKAQPNLAGVIEKLDKCRPDLIISDVFMGEANAGLKLLEKISDRGETELWQCWVMTQNPESTEEILNFPPTATFDPKENYLKKSELLDTKLSDCLNINERDGKNFRYAKKLADALKTAVDHVSVRGNDRLGDIVSISPLMNGDRGIFYRIKKFAAGNSNVLLYGESGTGKELVARAIHQNSPRKDKKFQDINCAAINENLLESELFGHEKGAFTGAVAEKKGLFEVADGGTLFLDEIGELDVSLQAKLLRALQERQIKRVGGTKNISVDVRIIAATNKDLLQMSREGGFREDLYYRLNVLSIEIPPLRERRCDIPLLIKHFIVKQTKTAARKVSINAEAKRVLEQFSYPGNIRQLESAIESAILLCENDNITVADLPQVMRDESISLSTEYDGEGNTTVADELNFKDKNNEAEIWQKLKANQGKIVLDLTDKGGYWKENAQKCYDIMALAAKDFNNHLSNAETELYFNIDIKALRRKTKSKEFDPSILSRTKRKS